MKLCSLSKTFKLKFKFTKLSQIIISFKKVNVLHKIVNLKRIRTKILRTLN